MPFTVLLLLFSFLIQTLVYTPIFDDMVHYSDGIRGSFVREIAMMAWRRRQQQFVAVEFVLDGTSIYYGDIDSLR